MYRSKDFIEEHQAAFWKSESSFFWSGPFLNLPVYLGYQQMGKNNTAKCGIHWLQIFKKPS